MHLTLLPAALRYEILKHVPAEDVLPYARAFPEVWCDSSVIQLLLSKLPTECRAWFYLGGEDETSGADTRWNVGPIDDSSQDKRMAAWRRAIRLFFSAMMGHPIVPREEINEAPVDLDTIHVMFELNGKYTGGERTILRMGPCTMDKLLIGDRPSGPMTASYTVYHNGDETFERKEPSSTSPSRLHKFAVVEDNVSRLRMFAVGAYNQYLNEAADPDGDHEQWESTSKLTIILLCPTHGLITTSEWTMKMMEDSCVDAPPSDSEARVARLTFERDYKTTPLFDETKFFWTPKEFRNLAHLTNLDLVCHFEYDWPDDDEDEDTYRYEFARIREPNYETRVQLWFDYFRFDNGSGTITSAEWILEQEILLGRRARNNREERMSVGVPITVAA